MNRLNDEQNERILSQIEVNTTVFKKIYRFTEFHYGNVSKSFIYITIDVEIYENENDNDNENDDNNYTNISIYTDASCDSDMNADAHSVKTTNSYSSKVSSKYRKNKKNIMKKIKIQPEKQEQEQEKEQEQEQEQKQERLNNHDSSDCDPNNPIKPKYSLDLNKIKNIVNTVKMETHKKIKKVPIKKKINIIIEKITNKLQSELMKEYMNYILVLENNSKKQKGSYVDKLNAFYHVILNKIESNL